MGNSEELPQNILEYLEDKEEPVDYIMAVPMYSIVQRKIVLQRRWWKIEKGLEITEFEYRAQELPHPRRMVAVRQRVAIRPNAVWKQRSLVEDDCESLDRVRHSRDVVPP